MIDIRQCGAVGDGRQDDTAAIQEALDTAAGQRAGSVYFPIGEYLVTGTLHLPHLVGMCGAGPCFRLEREAPTHIKHCPSEPGPLFALDYDLGDRPYREGGIYERLFLTGNGQTTALFDLQESSYTTLRDCYLGSTRGQQAQTLLSVSRAMLNVFERCKFINASESLVRVRGGANTTTHQHFRSCYFTGVETPWAFDLDQSQVQIYQSEIESTLNGITLANRSWLTGFGLTVLHLGTGIRSRASTMQLLGSEIRARVPLDMDADSTFSQFGLGIYESATLGQQPSRHSPSEGNN